MEFIIGTILKSIHTLIPDIYKLVGSKDGTLGPDVVREFSDEVALRLTDQFAEQTRAPTLRLSQMGPRCDKALWHSIRTPHLAEPFPPWALIKFSYGHILEALVIALAKAAGHDVKGEQDELDVLGVKGHRDCIIDGCLVDVKSSAGHYFQKFKDGSIKDNDTFGYLDQLDGYLVGSAEDDLVTVKDRAYLLAVDKHLGHLVLYEHHLRKDSILQRVAAYKTIVARDTPPECTCEVVKDGESGNFALGVNASYSNFKFTCFPGLRTFLYSGGPRYLTRVGKRPQAHIIEVDKHGRKVYT